MHIAAIEEYGRVKFLNGSGAEDQPHGQAYALFRRIVQGTHKPRNSRGEEMQCHFAEIDSDGIGCFIRLIDKGAVIIVESGLVRLCTQIGLVSAITAERDFQEEDAAGLTWLWHRNPFAPGREFSRETYDSLFSCLSSRQSEIFYTSTNQVLFFILMHELGHLRFGHLGMISDKVLRPEMKDGGRIHYDKSINPALMKAAEIQSDNYGYYQALQGSLLAQELRADFTWLNSVDRVCLLNFGLLQLFTVWNLFDILESHHEAPDETMVPEFYPIGSNDMTVVFNQRYQPSILRIIGFLGWVPDGISQLLENIIDDDSAKILKRDIISDLMHRPQRLTNEVWLFRAVKASLSFLQPSHELVKILSSEYEEIYSGDVLDTLRQVEVRWGYND